MLLWDILEIIIAAISFGFNLTCFIWRLTKKEKQKIFVEYVIWNVIAQIVYYTLFLIIAIKRLVSEQKDSIMLKFLKNILFKYLFPLIISSAIIFYIGYALRWIYFDTKNKGNDFWLIIFLHTFSQIGCLVDFILFNRKYIPTHFLDFLILTAIYVCYCILFCSIRPDKNSDNPLKPRSISFIISMMIMCYFVYFYIYFIFMYILKFKSVFLKCCCKEGDDLNKLEDSKELGKEGTLLYDNENNI